MSLCGMILTQKHFLVEGLITRLFLFNTASHSYDDIDELVCELESELRNILKWFKTKVKISIEDRTIYPSNDLKVLGVTIDKDFKFYKHVSDICCKAAR